MKGLLFGIDVEVPSVLLARRTWEIGSVPRLALPGWKAELDAALAFCQPHIFVFLSLSFSFPSLSFLFLSHSLFFPFCCVFGFGYFGFCLFVFVFHPLWLS